MSNPNPALALPRLILASASPRRQALLRQAGYQFIVHPSDINEDTLARDLLPSAAARQLAMAKAEAVANKFPDDVVLAADTVVAFGDQMLGKPANAAHARQMLLLLEGTTHVCITGVAVIHRRLMLEKCARVMSAVRMKRLSRAQIEAYVAGNDWQGKAGGYGLQDQDPFVMCLAGCPTNIVGLPMTTTMKLLGEAGVSVEGKADESVPPGT